MDALLERRLAEVARTTPAFAAALRAYRRATLAGDQATAEGLIAWIGGQPHVAAAARRAAGIREIWIISPPSASCKACSRSSGIQAIPGCSWSWTR